jgi:antitoxin HigA-1
MTIERAQVRSVPRPAIHPGEILADELEELSVTPTELARQLRVPANHA